jgi:hypothetical protein
MATTPKPVRKAMARNDKQPTLTGDKLKTTAMSPKAVKASKPATVQQKKK